MSTLLDNLMPFESAVNALAKRKALPTSLDSSALRQLGADFHRSNLVSAQTLITDLLDGYKEAVDSLINPVTVQRADRVTADNPQGNVTEGLNPADARLAIKQLQDSLGMVKGDGSLTDLTSEKRINLVIKTNVELSQGAGHFIQANDPNVVEAFPAQELVRFEARKMERDWPGRWRIAAAVAGDVDAARVLESTGRMVALKESGIWSELGNAEDGLGNPYPPFAFNSGMWVQDVSYDEAITLGLLDAGEQAAPAPLDLSQLFSQEAA